MKRKTTGAWVVIAGCMLAGLAGFARAAALQEQTSKPVRPGSHHVLPEDFRAPNVEPNAVILAHWKLHVPAAQRYYHRPNSQSPTWRGWIAAFPTNCAGTGTFSCIVTTNNITELNFQYGFRGYVDPCPVEGGAGGAGGPPSEPKPLPPWLVDGKTTNTYFVLPSYTNVCLNGQITFWARNEANWAVPSTWTTTPAGLTPLTPTSGVASVTYSATEPGHYTVRGVSDWNPSLTDSAGVDAVSSQILEPKGLPIFPLDAIGSDIFRANPYCFKWQYVHVINERVPYHATQPIEGLVKPIPPAAYNWSVSEGKLEDAVNSKPTYVPDGPIPNAKNMVDLSLRPLGAILHCEKTRQLEVYRDHLERDYQNFGKGIPCGAGGESSVSADWKFERYDKVIRMPHSWNCFGSVWHAYDGTKGGYVSNGIPQEGFAVQKYDDPIPWEKALKGIKRGDIVSFYTYYPDTNKERMQHAHTCLGSSEQMYGANNRPEFRLWWRQDSTGKGYWWSGTSWEWWVVSSKDYYEKLNASHKKYMEDFFGEPYEGQLINRIRVHRRKQP